MEKRILVTGASGFVGAHLILALAAEGFSVTAVRGNSWTSRRVDDAADAVASCQLEDLTMVRDLIDAAQPEIIIHAAGLTDVASCEADPVKAAAANVSTTRNLLSALPTEGIPIPFIFFSSDHVFGNKIPPPGGFTEDSAPAPCSVYGDTKCKAEALVLKYERGVVLRTSLVYGPPIGTRRGFLGWLHGSLEEGKEVSLFEDEYRTPILMSDLSKGILKLADNALELGQELPRILHVAGSERISRYAFGERLAETFGFAPSLLKKIRLGDPPLNAHRPRDVSLNIARLKDLFDVHPLPVREGLRELKSTWESIQE